jgi:hypothetical protein
MMAAVTGPMRIVRDPEVPALEILLGAEATDVVSAVVAPSGGSVRSLRVRQVRYVPAKSVTVQYDAEVQVGRATVRSTLVASSGLSVPGDVVRLEGGGLEIAAWTYPYDPFLPGLAAAAHPERVRELLSDLGDDPSDVTLRRRAYRAGRRAVIEVTSATTSIFLKVVRPDRAMALQEIHRAMLNRVPIPQSLGWSMDLGIVALQGLRGRPLRKAIQDPASPLPGGVALIELLDRLPRLERRAAAGPVARVPAHIRLLSAVLPELADRLDAMARQVSRIPAGQEAPAHGDFHAGQILVDGEHVSGLVDVDTAGMGDRADDYAGLLAQLSTLAIDSSRRERIDQYGAALIRAFDQHVDPVGLRIRVGAAVLGFATGPFRVQMGNWADTTKARVALAERWIASHHGSGDLPQR